MPGRFTMATDPYMGRFLLERLANEPRDLQIVVLLMAAMKEEQGEPPVVPDPAPVTDVGSQILKLIAASYSSHPDYKREWAPQV
jgi:hypothetical protein